MNESPLNNSRTFELQTFFSWVGGLLETAVDFPHTISMKTDRLSTLVDLVHVGLTCRDAIALYSMSDADWGTYSVSGEWNRWLVANGFRCENCHLTH